MTSQTVIRPKTVIGPKTVIDSSLVLHLDSANTKSYPRSGTDWFNLAPYQYSASLVNGPAFNNTGISSIIFDGTNDYAAITPNPIWSFGTSSFTVGIWVKRTSGSATSTGGNIIRHDNAFSGGLWYLFENNINDVRFEIYSSSRTNPGDRFISSYSPPTPFNDGKWHYVVGVRTHGSGIQVYYDGVAGSFTSVPTNTDITAAADAYPAIARAGSFNTQYYAMTASIVQIYNRALSATEILQNYNGLKGRFGII